MRRSPAPIVMQMRRTEHQCAGSHTSHRSLFTNYSDGIDLETWPVDAEVLMKQQNIAWPIFGEI